MQKALQQTNVPRWLTMARRFSSFTGKTALTGALLAAGWLGAPELKAQTIQNNYDFAASSGTYTPLGATAVQLPLLKADTYISPAQPIGFTFNFDGIDYTEFRASSDGYLSFGTSTTSSFTNDLANTVAARRPLIAPLWDDLDGNATGGVSNASYELTGTAGSRVLTFEWRNWEWNYSSSAPVISFQVKLYEGTNKIEFVYQPESGAIASGSASVGLAGVGAGNFMSLNNLTATPTVSFTSETTSINTKPATGQVYSFTRVMASATDLMASALIAPVAATGCYPASQTVIVAIKNNGTAPLDFTATPATVTASATIGTNTTTFPAVTVNTGTLAPGATQNVTVAANYQMSAAGTYTFNASATVPGDGRTQNDAMAPATVTLSGSQAATTATLPDAVDFTGFTGSNLPLVFPNWREAAGVLPTGTTAGWTNKSGLGGATNVVAKINLYSNSKRDWMIGPKITPTATTVVSFKAAVTTFGGTAAHSVGMTGTDDKVQVMVSTDCGLTFTPVFTMDAASNLTNTLTPQSVSLAAYAGQDIVVAFFATEGTVDDAPDYDFNIDDIFIGTPPTADLGATAIVNPAATGCYTATENVVVTIQNFGSAPIDFSATNATVSLRTHGATGSVISVPVTTGTLAPGATQNVTVGTLNMTTAGTYNFRAYTTFAGDNTAVNDTARTTRTVAALAALPQNVDFTGFTGSNLTTLFPDWREASGATMPSGTTSSWTSKTGLGSATNVTAKINLYTTGKNEWIVGPKVMATANTVVRFKAAITDYNVLTPAVGGMQADDKVQVMVSTDCGASFTPVFTMDPASNLTNVLTEQSVPLAAYAGQEIIVAFFGTEGATSGTQDYDFHLDDIKLHELAPNELAMVNVVMPSNTCGMTTTETICVNIRNNGTAATTSFPVSYTVNGGTPVTETATLTIAPGAVAQYCFTTKANFSAPGVYTVVTTVNLAGDADLTNDSATGTTDSKPMIAAFPYTEGFESGAGGWTASGTNSTWALGAPTGTLINTAGGGTNSWVTNLSGNYVNNEHSVVTGPCFNFTNVANPHISMKIFWNLENSYDGVVLQSSIDGGVTWQRVGKVLDPVNWYNDSTINAGPGGQPGATAQGWTGTGTNGSGGWVTASHALTGLGGQASVQLRFAFASDGSTVNEGFAFDDISITNLVAAPTVTAGGPTTFCQGGSVVLTAASAAPGATFTWELNGTAIPGATSATYTATTSGSYTAVVNAGGTATSTPIVVTVTPAAATPTVTAAGSTTICSGNSVALTAASATTGATYAWFLNGTAIPGATAATFTANAAGSYTVVATAGGCASAASTATAVTVTPTPATPIVTSNGVALSSSATTGNQWYLNGTLIPGATGQTYNPTASGNYTVISTVNSCPSAPSTGYAVGLGVKDALAGMSVNVYPNPANGSFNVKLNGYQKDATVVLYNLAGQQITAEKVSADGKAKNIDIKGLAAGTYLLKVTSDKGVQVSRLVVQ